MDIIDIATLLAAFFVGIYLFVKWRYKYWQRKGVPYIEPELYYGNVRKMIKREISFGEQFKEIYDELKSRGVKHGGAFALFTPLYMPIDPGIIKCILQSDFKHFMNHGVFVNEENDPLTGHLFNLEGQKWRRMRTKLTPTFTSGKMKMMFHTFLACTEDLEGVLNDHAIIQDAVNIKDITSRFTNDVIVSCAFGMDCNSLKNPNNEFLKFGQNIFNSGILGRIKQLIVMLVPRQVLIKIGFKQTSSATESFFMKVIKDIVTYRESNNIVRKDVMSLLIQMKNKGSMSDEDVVKENEEKDSLLTMNELTAQCLVFYLAGFETSATTMTFALYELALNQNIQDKLREEICSVLKKHNGNITYEAVSEMTYLDKVLNETLRKHPPVPGTIRVCNENFTIPGTNVVIKAGTKVHIPIYGIQNDPEYYPDPDTFDPERFSPENKENRPAFTYLPFGEGPRICIGLRFGLMQSKVGILKIIQNFMVTLNEKTANPMRLDTRAFILGVRGGVWLNVARIT
ncbi:probable cytochrome P450 6a20 [Anoplophora glabripennis]|uniref:probable cytochrome P450 6a20 n=1 Tax=Anoplophora glabripennis TaxID=217634 RepID=UPI0008742897|nr:probable cytochrome P450 6a20 [Anoplophora glabripennis]